MRLILIIIIGSAIWCYHIKPDIYLQENTQATLTNLHIVEFNENGVKIHEVIAPQVTHANTDVNYHITKPYIRTTESVQSAVEINAQHAIANTQEQYIIFQNQVNIKAIPKNAADVTTLLTESLHYNINTQDAYTDSTVMINNNKMKIKSRGLHANLAKHDLQLLHATQGSYIQNPIETNNAPTHN